MVKGFIKTVVFGAVLLTGVVLAKQQYDNAKRTEVKIEMLQEDINFESIYTRKVLEGATIVCACEHYTVNTSKVVDPFLPKEKYFRLHAVCQQGDHEQSLSFSTARKFPTRFYLLHLPLPLALPLLLHP